MGGFQTKEEKELPHTPFSKKDLHKIRKTFAKVTGSSTETELDREAFKQTFEICMDFSLGEGIKVDLDALFDSADLDHGGTVSFREFVYWLAVFVKGSEEAKLTHIYETMDADNSGLLEGGELERIRKLLKTSLQNRGLDKALAKRKAAQLIRKLDSRGDGTITLEEWITMGKRLRLVEILMGKELVEMVQGREIATPSPEHVRRPPDAATQKSSETSTIEKDLGDCDAKGKGKVVESDDDGSSEGKGAVLA